MTPKNIEIIINGVAVLISEYEWRLITNAVWSHYTFHIINNKFIPYSNEQKRTEYEKEWGDLMGKLKIEI